MKLWVLKPAEDLPDNDNPWEPWYDKAFGFVVRAENEIQAREFAHDEAGDENRGEFMRNTISSTKEPWKDSRYTTCTELTEYGVAGVIIRDFSAA